MSRFKSRSIESLPYGLWLCEDCEVIFDRKYRPLWKRNPGCKAISMSGRERIAWQLQRYFYVGSVTKKMRKQLLAAEQDFLNGKPLSLPLIGPAETRIICEATRTARNSTESNDSANVGTFEGFLRLIVDNGRKDGADDCGAVSQIDDEVG